MGSFIFMYMSERLTIQDWALSERPREKFLEKGASSLSDAELLAILIRSGNRSDNAIDLARKILAGADNNLLSLRKFSYKDYKKFKGIGAGKALSIMAAFELASRCELQMTPVMARYNILLKLRDMETKKTLCRDTDNKMLGGVASGLAEYMNWDVTVVRLVFLFCLFAVQGSVLAYILAWIIVPSKYNPTGGLGLGKILLLLIICTLPILLFMLLFGTMFFGMMASFFRMNMPFL